MLVTHKMHLDCHDPKTTWRKSQQASFNREYHSKSPTGFSQLCSIYSCKRTIVRLNKRSHARGKSQMMVQEKENYGLTEGIMTRGLLPIYYYRWLCCPSSHKRSWIRWDTRNAGVQGWNMIEVQREAWTYECGLCPCGTGQKRKQCWWKWNMKWNRMSKKEKDDVKLMTQAHGWVKEVESAPAKTWHLYNWCNETKEKKRKETK